MPKALREATEKEIRIPKSYGEVEVRADTFNEEDRSVEVCWSTGARVKRYSWDEGYYMEELAVDKDAIRLDRFNAMSLLDTHDNYSMDSRLGTVIPGSVRIEGGKAYARIKFSKKQRAEELMQDVRDGHPLPISVGYKIHRYEKTEGADGQLPVLRAIDWEPLELSAVPIPADAGATSRSEPDGKDFETVLVRQDSPNAAPSATTKERPMNKREAAKQYKGEQLEALALGAGLSRKENETDDALRARLIDALDKEEREAAADKARKDAEAETARRAAEEEAQRRAASQQQQPPAGTLTAQQAAEQARQAVEAERTRRSDIESFARTAGLKLEDELVRTALDKGHSMEQFRDAVLDTMVARQAQNPTFPHIETRGLQDEVETRRAAVTNALLHRADPDAHKLDDAAREWRGMSLLQLQRELMLARGEKTRGLSDMEIAARAFHTTSDFPVILANVVRTTLLAGYQTFPNTFDLIAKRRTVTNFKEIRAVRFGENPELKKVNEHGEFPRGTMVEGSESYKIATYGRIIGMTRQMLINDELGAFAQVPNRWGRQVAKLEGDIVWGMIVKNAKMSSDGKALFHADHKNLGAAAALSVDALADGRKNFRKQTDIDGVRVDIAPKYLFVPTDLETTAEKILTQVTPIKTDDVVPASIRSLTPVSEYRLDALSATAWFLFAGKEDIDAGLEYAYLEGNEQPYTEERMGFDVDGVEYKVRHDFGAGLTDFRFGYMNPGA